MLETLKKIWNKISGFFSRLFEKDLFIKLGSFLAAIIIWFCISVSVYPTMDKVIYNVPVEIALDGTYAESNGYQPISQSAETVTVYLTGDRGEVGNLTADELVAVASADNVMYAMEYKLPIKIQCSTGKKFEVTKTEPEVLNVSFDRLITKSVPVKPMISGIHAAEGYVMDDFDQIAVVPNTVEITGPAEIIETVSEAAAIISEDTSLTNTVDIKTTSLRLYSGSKIISDEENKITFDKSDFTVHIPVYKQIVLTPDVRIVNAPSNFDIEAFKSKLEYSVSEIVVAASQESANDRTSIDIGTIDMREVDIGSEFIFYTDDFLTSEGYIDWHDIGSVKITCPSEGLVRRPIHITNSYIQLINAPSQYDFEIITSGFTPIFVGPEESIEKLSYMDIIAQIDMLTSFDMEEGYNKLPVTFNISSYDDIWCIGSDGILSPKATIKATLKK